MSRNIMAEVIRPRHPQLTPLTFQTQRNFLQYFDPKLEFYLIYIIV